MQGRGQGSAPAVRINPSPLGSYNTTTRVCKARYDLFLLHCTHLQDLFPTSTDCHAPPVFSKVSTSSSQIQFCGFLFHLSTVLYPWPCFTASTISWKVTITRDFQSSGSVSLYIGYVTATTYINTTVISPAADTIFKLWPVKWNQTLDGAAASAAKVRHSLPSPPRGWPASSPPFTTACQSSGRHCMLSLLFLFQQSVFVELYELLEGTL